jgi:hypothetical protein
MTNEEVLRRWHAAAGKWARWLKPSLFAQLADEPGSELSPQSLDWAPPAGNVALILDLAVPRSIALGVALAARGYCPVPLFNTTRGTGEYVPTGALCRLLKGAADRLEARSEGPPVFLLDSARDTRPHDERLYDNRWHVFESDLPSARLLSDAGIGEVRVVCEGEVARDLHDALAGYRTLLRAIQRPDAGELLPFPKDRWSLVRKLAYFSRLGIQNWDGGYGQHRAPSRHG